MDRQAALIEEKTDAVKEYVSWRSLPVDLALRVKKHYASYFTRRPAFDEVQLLDGLSPSLRSEVTRYVLSQTLGRLPLFVNLIDPEFQLEIFPLIKPVTYLKGEVVFKRGEPSRDLFFLLEGEVSVISSITGTETARITPQEEITISISNPGEEVMRQDHNGCFGESVLTGRRRPATHIASASSEMLLLTNSDLFGLCERNPRAARRIIVALVAEMERKERIHILLLRFIISSLPKDSQDRSILIIQKAWKRYANANAMRSESILATAALGVDEVQPAGLRDTSFERAGLARVGRGSWVAQGKQAAVSTRYGSFQRKSLTGNATSSHVRRATPGQASTPRRADIPPSQSPKTAHRSTAAVLEVAEGRVMELLDALREDLAHINGKDEPALSVDGSQNSLKPHMMADFVRIPSFEHYRL